MHHKWLVYLEDVLKDPRINVWHIAIILAIIRLGHHQNTTKNIRVSRSKIMELSHINTFPTYHKYFKQLQNFGYIKYTPSYHPGFRSEIDLLTVD